MIANPGLFPEEGDSQAIREWWHSLLREQGRYPSFAFFLVLPSDKQATAYLAEHGLELDFVSGKDCLILVLNKNKFRRSGFDEALRPIETLRSAGLKLNIAYWKALVKDQTSDGYSVRIANHFDISYTEFPCLVIFQSIHSSEHIIISLVNLKVEEIAVRMKTIFSLLHTAVSENRPILRELEKLCTREAFQRGSQALVSSIRTVAGKSFETAIEVWIKSLLG